MTVKDLTLTQATGQFDTSLLIVILRYVSNLPSYNVNNVQLSKVNFMDLSVT